MTQTKRIILNVIATYGRSLYAIAIGLFCGRWTLMSLGQIDYGLMGVVGGMTMFISYFSNLLSSSIGRFYALSVGESITNPELGLEHSRMWFTTATVVQTIWPTAVMIVGYPIGIWAVRHFLTIPIDRIDSCVWVWRFVCISCYGGLISAPLNAMYGAKQYIAEVTIYSFFTTTLNAFFLYYMVTHPGDWLAKYAFWQCVLSLTPTLIIAIRAYCLFPECRIIPRYLKCWGNVKRLFGFAMWVCLGSLGAMLRGQGIAILVNKYFGPKVNAGVAVGSNLSAQSSTLAGSLIGAFSPAIYNAWGAGDYTLARTMAYRVCKLGTLLILVFAIPLVLEVDEVLLLWLKQPPMHAAEICMFVIAMTVIDKTAVGHMICVNANGKIAKYQMFLGTSLIMTLPLAWVLIELGVGVLSVGWAMVGTMIFCANGRVWFARSLVGMSARYWAMHILLPLFLLICISFAVGSLPKYLCEPSFLRVCFTTVLVELVLIPFSWFLILDEGERGFVKSRTSRFFKIQ